MIEGKRSSNIRENSVVPALAPVPTAATACSEARPSSGHPSMHVYVHHRVHTEWQRPLSGVHSIIMEKFAQAGEGRGCLGVPLTLACTTCRKEKFRP